MSLNSLPHCRFGKMLGLASLGLLAFMPLPSLGQTFQASTCTSGPTSPPACNPAIPRGDRADGWMAQSRSEVMARNGIVTTSQPLAAQAGLSILQRGGNAVDAAVATAATLGLVEPLNVGIAGDLFVIIYTAKDHKFHLLNSSGYAPSGMTREFMNANGYRFAPQRKGRNSGMPLHGILPVTIPGSVWGWQEALDKYGTLTFKDVLQPAVDYATFGFPVSERIATEWHLPKAVNADGGLANCCSDLDPDSVKTWYVDGKPPLAGQIFRNPDLAKAMKLLQTEGRDAFYKGDIAKAIIAKSRSLGGTMTFEDLASFKGEWVEPITSDYHGFTLMELPPPSQGFAANEMLNILEACVDKVFPGQSLASMGASDVRYWHMLVEAKKLAYADLLRFNGDPDFNPGLLDRVRTKLLSKAHAASLCKRISPTKAIKLDGGDDPDTGDTVVISTADRWGNMVSWVNSNFDDFGSGLTVPGYGFILHDRGALFTLDPDSPNVIAPHKRPFNTLAAGFVLPGGRTDGQLMTLLLMSGEMQSQGHAQIMVDLVDLGANLQAATDMARFNHSQTSNNLYMETNLYNLAGPALAAMGDSVKPVTGLEVGGYQGILFTPDATPPTPGPDAPTSSPVNGFYRAGSDNRKDGAAVGW